MLSRFAITCVRRNVNNVRHSSTAIGFNFEMSEETKNMRDMARKFAREGNQLTSHHSN